MRLLTREDLRHLLKHKRMYCRESLTPVEKRVLKRHSWVRDLWFRTGKPVYRVVTRKILHWEDSEGQGPKPWVRAGRIDQPGRATPCVAALCSEEAGAPCERYPANTLRV